MAQIEIQEKKRSVWPWVLVALLLALLAWWLLSQGDDVDDGVVTETGTGIVADPVAGDVGPTAAPAAVGAFLTFVEQAGTRGEMGLNHEYTADGLRRLADALAAFNTGEGADAVNERLTQLRARADALQREASSTRHAELTRDAFAAAAAAVETLQERRFPALSSQADALVESAGQIQPGTLLLEQRQAVHGFFERAATTLRAMADTNV